MELTNLYSLFIVYRPVLYLFLSFFFLFQDRVTLCSPGCPGIHTVDQAGLELRNLHASASQVLRLKVCSTTWQLVICFISVTFKLSYVNLLNNSFKKKLRKQKLVNFCKIGISLFYRARIRLASKE